MISSQDLSPATAVDADIDDDDDVDDGDDTMLDVPQPKFSYRPVCAIITMQIPSITTMS